MQKEKELLASIKLGDHDIDFYRDHSTGGISICDGNHCAALPVVSGLQATELFEVLEKVGKSVEFPVETVYPAKVLKDGEEYPPSDEEEMQGGE